MAGLATQPTPDMCIANGRLLFEEQIGTVLMRLAMSAGLSRHMVNAFFGEIVLSLENGGTPPTDVALKNTTDRELAREAGKMCRENSCGKICRGKILRRSILSNSITKDEPIRLNWRFESTEENT